MQPRIITLPDPLRDALERDLARVFGQMPSKISWTDHSKEIDACGQIVAWHLLGIAPRDPGLVTGPGADDAHDPETKQFLKEFYQAYLGMECGTSSPVLQLENLPPDHGRLFNIGLMHSLNASKNIKNMPILGAIIGNDPQEAHRDMGSDAVGAQRKVLQSLYCQAPGDIAQPTVFVSVDEVIDHLAQQESGDRETARKLWEKRLSAIHIRDWYSSSFPLITPNPAWQHADSATDREHAPKYILYTRGRFPNDMTYITETDPTKYALQTKHYKKFADTLTELMRERAATATGSRTANTLLLWNDALVLHGRGPLLGEGVQENRKIEATEVNHYPELDPEGLAHAIGGPCSKAKLDQLTPFGTLIPPKEKPRTV